MNSAIPDHSSRSGRHSRSPVRPALSQQHERIPCLDGYTVDIVGSRYFLSTCSSPTSGGTIAPKSVKGPSAALELAPALFPRPLGAALHCDTSQSGRHCEDSPLQWLPPSSHSNPSPKMLQFFPYNCVRCYVCLLNSLLIFLFVFLAICI